MVRSLGRARGKRAKHEAQTGAPELADVEACPPGRVIYVSEYQPPRIPAKKWRERHSIS